MQDDVAGDPITGTQWTRRTTRKIADELTTLGISVSRSTVARLLKQMDYRLCLNRKHTASTTHPGRNQQFVYIGQPRDHFARPGQPILSVDTNKKEQVGCFKNPGQKWDRQPVLVRDHDFRSDADGLAIPHGIYDVQANLTNSILGSYNAEP